MRKSSSGQCTLGEINDFWSILFASSQVSHDDQDLKCHPENINYFSVFWDFSLAVEKQNKENGQKKEFEKKHSTCMIGPLNGPSEDCKPRDLGQAFNSTWQNANHCVIDHF